MEMELKIRVELLIFNLKSPCNRESIKSSDDVKCINVYDIKTLICMISKYSQYRIYQDSRHHTSIQSIHHTSIQYFNYARFLINIC